MTIPLDLFAEVTTGSGARYKWDANQAPGSRPQHLRFSTKIGEGFSDGSAQLARRIDQDYPDLNLVDTVTITGADGSVAYEGRITSMPRDLSDTHSIGLTLAGWMSHAKDRKFREIYVNRDLTSFGGMGVQRKLNLIAGVVDGEGPTVVADVTNGIPALETTFTGAWGRAHVCEAWYDAGGIPLGSIYYAWKRNGIPDPADTHWHWFVSLASDDVLTGGTYDQSAELRAAGPSSGTLAATTATRNFAMVQQYYDVAGGGDGINYGILWTCLAVYGTHGLTKQGTEDATHAKGFYASDVMKDIASRFCPSLDISGVEDTTFVIEQLAFIDPTFPYDAFLELNKYHLWRMAVWEDKRLDFGPYDLTDYDWEIRTDDPGTTFAPQGPSTDTLCNGIVVTYNQLPTGRLDVLTPDEHTELKDPSPENPWNQHGLDHWDEITISTPVMQATALQLGQAALADRNRPKTPGTITVNGYIRDRAGNKQPVWKVRAGDTISITNFPNDSPRLIVETDYDDDAKQITIAIDKPFALLDAYLDRVGNALAAAGLTAP
jgi:hypothetical protein